MEDFHNTLSFSRGAVAAPGAEILPKLKGMSAVTEECVLVQVEDVKGELLERYKVLPGLSSRLAELEAHYEEMREKNRQLEQKLVTMQVIRIHLNSQQML